jgi:hypothetical protein
LGGLALLGSAPTITSTSRLLISEEGRSPQDLSVFEACRVHSSIAVALADGANTNLTFDTVDVDTFGGFALATPDSITIPSGSAGFYLITSHVSLAANATGQRYLNLVVNGVRVAGQIAPAYAGVPTNITCTAIAQLAVGDAITTDVFQNSGGPLNALAAADYSPVLEICRLI